MHIAPVKRHRGLVHVRNYRQDIRLGPQIRMLALPPISGPQFIVDPVPSCGIAFKFELELCVFGVVPVVQQVFKNIPHVVGQALDVLTRANHIDSLPCDWFEHIVEIFHSQLCALQNPEFLPTNVFNGRRQFCIVVKFRELQKRR